MLKNKLVSRLLILSMIILVGGCASTSNNPKDPYESYNRAMFSFNETVDKAILKPVAQGYDAVVPEGINQGVTNFFNNLNDFPVVINDLLQGNFEQAGDDFYRLFVNTTVGVGGIFDVAGHAGVEKHQEDFGQTFAVWGADSGSYLVLPFFGPSNTRDALGLIPDLIVSPLIAVDNDKQTYWGLIGLNVVDKRADLLKAEKILDEAATDKYAYIRDAFMQRREYLIHNGTPPLNDADEDFLFEE